MDERIAEKWRKMLAVPSEYRYKKTLEPVKKYPFEKFDAELYLQSNGPCTFQRLLKVLPKKIARPLPAVAVPFYFPEGMIGFELETREILPRYARIAMMADLAERGFIAASADSYHLNFLVSDLPRGAWDRWQISAEALNRDYPEWCGIGKLTADTMRVVDALAEDSRVDSGRIGIAGHSLGGKMAFYCGCLDPRVKAILASDFGIGWEQTNWNDIWYWGDRVAELKKAGLDHSQLLSLAGGKPFLLLAGNYDNDESFELMKRASGYEAHPENLAIINHAAGHLPPPEILAQGYDFLEQNLKPN